VLTSEARRRLQAIEEFSDLGSGFNIAMRDLDIRGAGNLLGAEQSGFINEMGYETYLKILDEAIMELKEESFDGQLTGKDKDDFYVRDCMIETDLEILIPDDYVSDITERLSLYKELDNIETTEGIERFCESMKDRFGPIPRQTIELTEVVLLRKKARSLGFAKLVLKNNKLIGYFIPNEDSVYFQTPAFTSILEFAKENPAVCRMNQSGQKLTITVSYVRDIKSAMSFLHKIQV
jgi:transcription-repair coupling factor (superfamily II helicase)